MRTIPYDHPAHLFRVYESWECDEDGYPYIWDRISEVSREERLRRCEDCGFAYLEGGDILTVHHNNLNKADCRRANLAVYCWLHHSADHESNLNMRDIRCKFCQAWYLGWPRLRRHIRGIHRPFELKIPEVMLDKRPTLYAGRGKVLFAIQRQQRWERLWRD